MYNITIGILTNGTMIIFNNKEEGIEEPCQINIQQTGPDNINIGLGQLMLFSDKSIVTNFDRSNFIFTYTPNTRITNMFIDFLKDVRAAKTGIVAPSKADVMKLVKK